MNTKTAPIRLDTDLSGYDREENEPLCYLRGERLVIAPSEREGVAELDDALARLLRRSFLYRVEERALRFFSTLSAVGLVAFSVTAIDIYLDTSKKLLLEVPQIAEEGSGYFLALPPSQWIAIGISAAALLIFALLPNLASVDEADSFKSRILSTLFSDGRRKKRIERNLRRLLGQKRVREVEIYNFENRKELEPFVSFLAAEARPEDVPLRVHLRSGHMERIKRLCAEKGLSCQRVNAPSPGPSRAFGGLSRASERYYLAVLAACGLPPEREGEPHLVSVELAERFLSQKGAARDEAAEFSLFVEAAMGSFGILERRGEEIYALRGAVPQTAAAREARDAVGRFAARRFEELLQSTQSPLVPAVLLEKLEAGGGHETLALPRRVLACESFVERAWRKESYGLFRLLYESAGHPFGRILSDIPAGDPSERFGEGLNLYHELSPRVLEKLLTLFERSGFVADALRLCDYLRRYDPQKIGVVTGRLYHREGRVEEALERFASVDAGALEPEERLEYRRIYAWAIQDFRIEELREKGLALLEGLRDEALALRMPGALRDYYNTLANYREWEGAYEEAVALYRDALLIPGLGNYRYAALFTNMGVAYRKMFEALSEPQRKAKGRPVLDRAIENGEKGMALKAELGADDERHIALHNLAWAYLYRGACFGLREDLRRAASYAEEGLRIAARLGSSLKRPQLCAELAAARRLLGEPLPDCGEAKGEGGRDGEEAEKIREFFFAKGER